MNVISFNHHKYHKFKVVNTIPIVQMSISRFRKIKGCSQGYFTMLPKLITVELPLPYSCRLDSLNPTEYSSGLSFLPPGDLPNPGIKPMSLMSPALAGGFFTTWEAQTPTTHNKNHACYRYILGFPGGTSGKESVCLCRRLKRRSFNPWVGKIPWRRKGQPVPIFLPGECYGQRSLAGYSSSGLKESDTTEGLST